MVIIRCNLITRDEVLERLHKDFVKQAETGVILLPEFCDLLNEVDRDEEIVVVRPKWEDEQHEN